MKFHENPSGGNRVSCGRTDRQTDRHDEANSPFSKFCESFWGKEITFLKGAANFSVRERKRNEKKLQAEYCWAITQVARVILRPIRFNCFGDGISTELPFYAYPI